MKSIRFRWYRQIFYQTWFIGRSIRERRDTMRILIYPNARPYVSLALSRDNERWQGLSMLLQSLEPHLWRGAERSEARPSNATRYAPCLDSCAPRARTRVRCVSLVREFREFFFSLFSRRSRVPGDVHERSGEATRAMCEGSALSSFISQARSMICRRPRLWWTLSRQDYATEMKKFFRNL